MTAKETIDIEALLYRAYAQHRVHRVTPEAVLGLRRNAGPSGFAATMAILELGTRVDTSGAGAKIAGMQSMAAATPDDMLVVHDHVLALADWLIEGAETAEPRVWRRAEIRENGWRIEERADGLWLVRVERRAFDPAAHHVAGRLTNPYLAAAVIQHACAGTRPDCRPARRGRLTAQEEREVRIERALYAVWRAALGVLAAELDGKLAKHAVTGPAADAEPWTRRPLRDVPAPEAVPEAEIIGA